MSYGYIKKPVKIHKLKTPGKKLVVPKWFTGGLSGISFIAGLVLIGSVIWPLIQWQLFYLPHQPQDKIVSPLPLFNSPAVLASSSQNDEANNWLPVSTRSAVPNIKFYTLSIPKVRIEDATVEYGGADLKKSLVGWTDSSLPGNLGTNIIFGHSALPQFYDPKSYTNIFSLLPTLTKGDPIYINYDGVSYKYLVEEMKTVDPTDYSILEQNYDDSYLTLITCVPPGTFWKRLEVRARVSKF